MSSMKQKEHFSLRVDLRVQASSWALEARPKLAVALESGVAEPSAGSMCPEQPGAGEQTLTEKAEFLPRNGSIYQPC